MSETDERVCTKCGKGGVPPRCRVHEECLSSGSGGGTSAPRAAKVEAHLFFDDEIDRFRWSEAVWMDTACGESIHTIESAGFLHGCGREAPTPEDPRRACRLTRLSLEQPDHRDRIDWDQVDLVTVLAEPPSTFEAGFPEVFFRARGKSDDEPDENEEKRIDAHRFLDGERLDRVLNLLSRDDQQVVLAAARRVEPKLRACTALAHARQIVAGR